MKSNIYSVGDVVYLFRMKKCDGVVVPAIFEACVLQKDRKNYFAEDLDNPNVWYRFKANCSYVFRNKDEALKRLEELKK